MKLLHRICCCFSNRTCLSFLVAIVLILVIIESWHLAPHFMVPNTSVWRNGRSRNISLYVQSHKNTTLVGPESPCHIVPDLLIIIPSSINNTRQRSAIRKSWGQWATLANTSVTNNAFKLNATVKFFFLLGVDELWANNNIPAYLMQEYSTHNDLIIENFIDTYYNLTLKSIHILKWVSENFKDTKYLLKSDDDMFINIPNLLKVLDGKLPKRKLLLGHLICNAKPIHNQFSKWFSPKYMYAEKKYPNYLSGTAYLMSGDLVGPLLQAALDTQYFHLEDIFLTGICSKKINVRPRDNLGFSFGRRPMNPCIYSKVISSHEIRPSDQVKIWNMLHNPSTTAKCNLPKKTIFPSHGVAGCIWK